MMLFIPFHNIIQRREVIQHNTQDIRMSKTQKKVTMKQHMEYDMNLDINQLYGKSAYTLITRVEVDQQKTRYFANGIVCD